MKKFFCGLLIVLASLIGYRMVSDYLEDNRDFH